MPSFNRRLLSQLPNFKFTFTYSLKGGKKSSQVSGMWCLTSRFMQIHFIVSAEGQESWIYSATRENQERKRMKPSQNLEIGILLINTRLLGKSRCEVTPCFIQGKSQSVQEPKRTYSMQWWTLKYSNITPSTLLKHVVYRAFSFQSLKLCQVISFLWEHWNENWSEPYP